MSNSTSTITTIAPDSWTNPDFFEDARYIPLVVVGCVSSFLSMMGSSSVLYIASQEDLKKKILHRVVFGLSLADFCSSTALFFMPFSIPAHLGLPATQLGSFATCTATGFFVQTFLLMGCCYNAYLSLYYYLMVRRNWKERDFRKWGYQELGCHCFAILAPLVVGIAAAAVQGINPHVLANNFCTVVPYPPGCGTSILNDIDGDNELNDETEPTMLDCQRSSVPTSILLSIIPNLILIVFSATGFVCTGVVCCTVEETLRRSSGHRFQGDEDSTGNRRLLQVKVQTFLYTMSYLNTFFWPILAQTMTVVAGEEINTKKTDTGYYILQLCFWAFFPLQGALNFFIFTRVKVQRWRKIAPQKSTFWIYQMIVRCYPVPSGGSTSLQSGGTTGNNYTTTANNSAFTAKSSVHTHTANNSGFMANTSAHPHHTGFNNNSGFVANSSVHPNTATTTTASNNNSVHNTTIATA